MVDQLKSKGAVTSGLVPGAILGIDEHITNDDEVVATFTGQHDFRVSVSVRFPRCDLEFVKAQIHKAAATTQAQPGD